MNYGKTWLTANEVATILGVTSKSVNNWIKRGTLSAERDERGWFYIEKSEFFRVYPDYIETENEGIIKKVISAVDVNMLEEKIRHLNELLDEKRKQNEFLTKQLNDFTDEKSKMLDAINHHARLLEYKETGEKSPTYTDQHKKRKPSFLRRLFIK